MYCDYNFRTKKALKLAVARGDKVRIYAPGLGVTKIDGRESVEGPHYPQAHTWYAEVVMKDGFILSVK